MSDRDPRLEGFEALIGGWVTEATHPMVDFDSRGVRRTCCTSLEGGVLRVWRDQPGFDQRMSAQLGEESFEAVYQLAREPGEWKDDLRVVYRRRRG
jgi:hypothetical protein